MADSTPKENKNTLKYVSLITLTLQNAILGLSMRYAATRTKKEDRFISSTGERQFQILLFLLRRSYLITSIKLLLFINSTVSAFKSCTNCPNYRVITF